jgi:hypothetical protein
MVQNTGCGNFPLCHPGRVYPELAFSPACHACLERGTAESKGVYRRERSRTEPRRRDPESSTGHSEPAEESVKNSSRLAGFPSTRYDSRATRYESASDQRLATRYETRVMNHESRITNSPRSGSLVLHFAFYTLRFFVIPRTQSFYIKIGCHGQTRLAVLFFHAVLACPVYHERASRVEWSLSKKV